ncbi:conserved hypothetical protein [Leishmania mexicana MHOM/GT/2001/U1103]|uniref:C3H1-type domain-containing protein n=1 Tax=Leishmania mexicana (strain MHOM/GT/2001/U1103) TaxID=929439 RepID=E9B722_LEIMU|nr:conserved hypothetical protein [Leishmania mexicana MHOM/GT/2001/U1103]CBZ31045.1 conserved hypothetical protein [Leishmania mexicana MHOM/GT/2001/U1103]
MSGLDSHGKAMGEAPSDRQMSPSSLTAASQATPNPAAADGGAAAHVGGSPADNEMDEHVPPVIAHVRKNFGVLAPTIEPFIYRSGCLNKSVVDVYNNLSRNYIAIVDAALKQVGFEEFTMQMQIMLTQILSEEFGEDTEYLVNTILTYTGADSLFVSLLSKSMLDQVITYAQSIMSGNMYGMSYNMQSGGGGGGRGSEGAGNSYYRGTQQHHGYRGVGENGSSRDLRGSSVTASPSHHDGAAPQKPYRSSGLPPHSNDPGKERSSDDLRATGDVPSQREESRDWGGGVSVPTRGATVTGGVHVDSGVGPRSGAAPMSGMGAGAASRTEVTVSRTMSETASGAAVMPRHTHHHFSSSTAAAAPVAPAAPAAKSSSMERGGMSGAPQHNLLPPRASPASSQPRVPTLGAPSVSHATTTSSMPTMGRGGAGIPMHHHHHHLGIGAMATNSAAASDWAGNNSTSGPAPNINVAGQRTLTPPTPQSASMQQHQHQHTQQQAQQQLPQPLQPTRTMNIPAPLSVQRRTEKNAAAAAAAAAAAGAAPAAAPANGSAPANSSGPNSSSAAVEGGVPSRIMSAPLGGSANVPAPRGAQSLVHHQHHMPVSHHHHHHHHFVAPPPAVTAAVQPLSATHSPLASEERVATISVASTGSPAPETNLPANQPSASTPAPVRSPPATTAPTTSAPPPALRGLGRIPLHHHHHHMHLMVNKVDAASAPQRQPQQIPATLQPQAQSHLPQPQQRVATAIDVHDQQQQERTNAANGRWPNQKEELRGMLLTARVSESAITYLLTDVNIEELRGLKYVDFEKKLRGGVPLMLDRQRIRQVLSSNAAVQSQSCDNDDSATSSIRKTATNGVGAEEEAGGPGLPRRPPAISTGVQSPVTSHQSSPISKAGVQVPQPRTKMQQQQQQQTQQSINGGSAVTSPADASISSPEKDSDKREGGTKTGSPTTASGAPTSPVPASTPAPSPNSSYSPSTRNEDPEDSREEEQRRGGGRRGGKRGGLGRGGFNSSRVCRFFGTAEGCQYGDKCHYMHSK